MKQINTFALYELADALGAVAKINAAGDKIESILLLARAHVSVDSFLKEIVNPLGVSVDAANKVKSCIGEAMAALSKDEGSEEKTTLAQRMALASVSSATATFKTILAAEMQKLDTYMVTQVAGYSMPLLVRSAEVNIPERVVQAMPDDARKDFREAGRCLAFEVPTACGYHTMRATERIVRLYREVLTGKSDKIDLGPCIVELQRANADAKTLAVLDQVRDLHRNPLAHPEVFLSMEEAQGLFNIAISAITAAVVQIEKVRKMNKSKTAAAP